MVLYIVSYAFHTLSQPEARFKKLASENFEQIVFDYLRLLAGIAIIAGISSFLIHIIQVLYLGFIRHTTVQYANVFNYILGRSIGVIVIYLICGTFILFILSLVMRPFLKLKYTELLKRLMVSLTPVLLFGWIPILAVTMLFWSCVLFSVGHAYHLPSEVSQGSIHRRE